jgi:hypothetical protein
LDRPGATNSSAALWSNEKTHDAAGNDLHAIANGGLSSVKAPAQPHPRTAPTIYAIPELEAVLRLCAAIVDRLTFSGNIIGTGTDSFRLAQIWARAEQAR